MKSICLPFITVQREIKKLKKQRNRGGGSRKRTRAHMKNKTFPLITSVTSWLYSGIILDIFEDAEYTFNEDNEPINLQVNTT